MMERRSFLRTGLAAAVAGPGALVATNEAWALDRMFPRRSAADPIRLSSNENPLGMPESARAAIAGAFAGGSRYPQLDGQLIEAISKKHGVAAENVVLGTGSTEVLRLAVMRTALQPGSRLVVPEPSFEDATDYAEAFPIEIVRVPLRPDYAMDLDGMKAAAARGSGPVLVFLCNPNNPTATITSCSDIESWIRSAPERVVFLVDEAYFDFVDDPGYRTLIPFTERPNVIVSRTFSKIYGLAGLRAGYGVAHAETVKGLRALACQNNVNHLAQVAALACIDDAAYMQKSLEINTQGRAFATRTLRELGLEMLPSHTNFLMHRIRGEVRPYIDRMAEAGVRVGRPFPPMLGYNRVSIGLPEEMQAWADNLREFRDKGWV